jgi:hypothetical protein
MVARVKCARSPLLPPRISPRRPSIAHLSVLRQPRGDLVVPNASSVPLPSPPVTRERRCMGFLRGRLLLLGIPEILERIVLVFHLVPHTGREIVPFFLRPVIGKAHHKIAANG